MGCLLAWPVEQVHEVVALSACWIVLLPRDVVLTSTKRWRSSLKKSDMTCHTPGRTASVSGDVLCLWERSAGLVISS
jgi:hypothetical protein